MEEIWKDIPGYEGKYQASTEGRIRSLDRKVRGVCHYTGKEFYRKINGRVLRPGPQKSGHLSVVLGHGKAGSPVHQLVMKTFVGPPPKGCEVRHKNGDPTDNRITNLCYGTRRENILDVFYQGKAWRRLDLEDVEQIKFGLSCGIKGSELSQMFGVGSTIISKIKVGKTFGWVK